MQKRPANEALYHSTTLYSQIASILRSRITSGSLPPHSILPSIEDMCAQYNVSRPTVRQAIQMLVSEGLIVSQRGKPAAVAKDALDGGGGVFRDLFNEQLLAQEDHKILIIDSGPVTDLPEGLCFVGQPTKSYFRIKKVHTVADVPYCLMELFVDSDAMLDLPVGIERREKIAPLLMLDERLDITVARERIVVGAADFEEASALDYPMAGPVARMTRVLCGRSGNAVYVGRYSYRGDQFGLERDRGNYVTAPWQNMQR